MSHFIRMAAFATVLLAPLACTDGRARALQEIRGVQLSPVRAKPDFTLLDTDGKPFHFVADTRGTATLLYFGYTNCPDVCPTHLTNIAAAMKRLSPQDQAKVRVVFVTTDPARDTPTVLRGWLNNFDPRFIGLRGDIADVNRIQAALGLPPATIEALPGTATGAHAAYGVGHSAQVLGFTPDDSLRVEYPSGFTPADWQNDLPRLLRVK